MRRDGWVLYVVGIVLLVATICGLAFQLNSTRRDQDRLAHRVAALEARAAAPDGRATQADIDRLGTSLSQLTSRLTVVERAAEKVCPPTTLASLRARIEGEDAGSRYASTAFYTTMLNLLTAVCGAPPT